MSSEQKKKRAEFVSKYINNSDSTSQAVHELTAKLFISERTVYEDLKKSK